MSGTSSRKRCGGALVLWGGSVGLDQGGLGELLVHLRRHSDGFPVHPEHRFLIRIKMNPSFF